MTPQTIYQDLFSRAQIDQRGVKHYHSGANTGPLIEVFHRNKQAFCFSVADLQDTLLSRYCEAARDVPVLIDSGAFGAFTAAVRKHGEPWALQGRARDTFITDATADFERVFAVYDALALCAPDTLTVILPDVIGFQDASLDLLGQYRDRISQLLAMGVHLLLPIQRGPLSPEAYAHAAKERLGFAPTGWAIPYKAAAYTADEACIAVEHAIAHNIAQVHLLGCGVHSPRFKALIAALSGIPGADKIQLSTDSASVCAVVGGREPLTQWRRLTHETYDAVASNEAIADVRGGDLTESVHDLFYNGEYNALVDTVWNTAQLLDCPLARMTLADAQALHHADGDAFGQACESEGEINEWLWQSAHDALLVYVRSQTSVAATLHTYSAFFAGFDPVDGHKAGRELARQKVNSHAA